MSGQMSQFNGVTASDAESGLPQAGSGWPDLPSRHPALQPFVFQSRRALRVAEAGETGPGETGPGETGAARDLPPGDPEA